MSYVNNQSYNQWTSYEFKDYEIDQNESSVLLNSKRMWYYFDMVLLIDIDLILKLHSIEKEKIKMNVAPTAKIFFSNLMQGERKLCEC